MMKFNEINEPYECIMLLNDLNNLLDTLYKISDTGYYLDHIFNASSNVDEMIKEAGIDENYILDTIVRFEKLRVILYGDSINWKKVVENEMKSVAIFERKQNLRLNRNITELEHELKKIKENN